MIFTNAEYGFSVNNEIVVGDNILIIALSLRSFDRHRQYPADLSEYYSRCPSGKSKTICFICDRRFNSHPIPAI
jgi:hypothetical protein